MVSGDGNIADIQLRLLVELDPCKTCGEHAMIRMPMQKVVPQRLLSPGQVQVTSVGLSMHGRCLACGRYEYHEPDPQTKRWILKETAENWEGKPRPLPSAIKQPDTEINPGDAETP